MRIERRRAVFSSISSRLASFSGAEAGGAGVVFSGSLEDKLRLLAVENERLKANLRWVATRVAEAEPGLEEAIFAHFSRLESSVSQLEASVSQSERSRTLEVSRLREEVSKRELLTESIRKSLEEKIRTFESKLASKDKEIAGFQAAQNAQASQSFEAKARLSLHNLGVERQILESEKLAAKTLKYKEAKAKIAELSAKNEEKSSQISALHGEISALKIELVTAKTALISARQELDDSETNVAQVRMNQSMKSQKLVSMLIENSNNDRLLSRKLRVLERKVAGGDSILERERAEGSEALVENLVDKLARANEEIAHALKKYEKAKAEVRRLEEENRVLSGKVGRLESEARTKSILTESEADRSRVGDFERSRYRERDREGLRDMDRSRTGEYERSRYKEKEGLREADRSRGGDFERSRYKEREGLRDMDRSRGGEYERSKYGDLERSRFGDMDRPRTGETERLRSELSALRADFEGLQRDLRRKEDELRQISGQRNDDLAKNAGELGQLRDRLKQALEQLSRMKKALIAAREENERLLTGLRTEVEYRERTEEEYAEKITLLERKVEMTRVSRL